LTLYLNGLGHAHPDHEITKDLRETALFHVVRSIRAKPEAASAMTEIVFTGEDSWAERDLDRFFSEGEAELGGDGFELVIGFGALEVGSGQARDRDVAGEVATEAEAAGRGAEARIGG